MDGLPDAVLLLVVCILASALTQIASNAATATIIIPILIILSKKVQNHFRLKRIVDGLSLQLLF